MYVYVWVGVSRKWETPKWTINACSIERQDLSFSAK
jgi:hypothetical protein